MGQGGLAGRQELTSCYLEYWFVLDDGRSSFLTLD